MAVEEIIKKRLKKLKRALGINTERIEKELIPLQPSEELQPKVLKKKRKV